MGMVERWSLDHKVLRIQSNRVHHTVDDEKNEEETTRKRMEGAGGGGHLRNLETLT